MAYFILKPKIWSFESRSSSIFYVIPGISFILLFSRIILASSNYRFPLLCAHSREGLSWEFYVYGRIKLGYAGQKFSLFLSIAAT